MSLYYNNADKQTIYDIAREISIRTSEIRMLNPADYDTRGQELLNEIRELICEFNANETQAMLR